MSINRSNAENDRSSAGNVSGFVYQELSNENKHVIDYNEDHLLTHTAFLQELQNPNSPFFKEWFARINLKNAVHEATYMYEIYCGIYCDEQKLAERDRIYLDSTIHGKEFQKFIADWIAAADAKRATTNENSSLPKSKYDAYSIAELITLKQQAIAQHAQLGQQIAQAQQALAALQAPTNKTKQLVTQAINTVLTNPVNLQTRNNLAQEYSQSLGMPIEDAKHAIEGDVTWYIQSTILPPPDIQQAEDYLKKNEVNFNQSEFKIQKEKRMDFVYILNQIFRDAEKENKEDNYISFFVIQKTAKKRTKEQYDTSLRYAKESCEEVTTNIDEIGKRQIADYQAKLCAEHHKYKILEQKYDEYTDIIVDVTEMIDHKQQQVEQEKPQTKRV